MTPESILMLLLQLFFAALASINLIDAAARIPGQIPAKLSARMLHTRPTNPTTTDALNKSVLPSLRTDTKNILNFLHTMEYLKLNKRTGWHKCGIKYEKSESIADHMYRMAIMALLVEDDTIDKFKAVKMALVHDMAEAITGDITPSCGVAESDKNRLETEAMQRIRDMLGDNPFGKEAQELWLEYAADATKESQFVKDLDKTELYVQVVEYENVHKINFQEWLDRSRPKIRHPAFQAIADEVELQRPIEFLKLKQNLNDETTQTD